MMWLYISKAVIRPYINNSRSILILSKGVCGSDSNFSYCTVLRH